MPACMNYACKLTKCVFCAVENAKVSLNDFS